MRESRVVRSRVAPGPASVVVRREQVDAHPPEPRGRGLPDARARARTRADAGERRADPVREICKLAGLPMPQPDT